MPRNRNNQKLVREVSNGDVYEYYPLGKHVVIAPGVCGGRPTFKGTRIEVKVILDWIRAGRDIDRILKGYPRLTRDAVEEAIALATKSLMQRCASLAA